MIFAVDYNTPHLPALDLDQLKFFACNQVQLEFCFLIYLCFCDDRCRLNVDIMQHFCERVISKTFKKIKLK